ncbi:MAG TPA: [FeFe] hydrogenase H-cluster radical SAM maturase HydE [Candidatus Coprenecus stercoravium]|uniref:[FeFe] hydrogenase H-cluster radical SAM maturase HydE n=1 Tax=Candidatus Coprenecus stercoravium TaxID=2840735 RepID=A0A9D2KA35_9BACT|nr:[FeFe] hydrogenase H-cluster radical SAM maturase HydE [Candidatus Coprenecus stercoravium]
MTREELISALEDPGPENAAVLYAKAYEVKKKTVGESVYLRGLVEISNICRKNCLYCGIRRDNGNTRRYELEPEEVLRAAEFAYNGGYGSLVIQGGERTDRRFIDKITSLLAEIKRRWPLGITLSLGEQSKEVYREWFEAGAHRYLLRIESSTKELYEKIHPADALHSYETRLEALVNLRGCGYQVGTGVMIGLPFQTAAHLADDLLFFKRMDIDMCGMGPYLEHSGTPLYEYRDRLMPKYDRLELSLRMVALLRLLMPDINIAATTAMQAIAPDGRERAIMAGANVLMPNLTLSDVREEYQIYQNKPGVGEDAAISSSMTEKRLRDMKIPIGYGRWGDSLHFSKR